MLLQLQAKKHVNISQVQRSLGAHFLQKFEASHFAVFLHVLTDSNEGFKQVLVRHFVQIKLGQNSLYLVDLVWNWQE